ncbi:transposable element Tcb1 transposase [Trichonephila clavipes]|nr:transposable element Tcb1 transposase [Trichonephila clavipes]
MEHNNWTNDYWSQVILRDLAKISLFGSDNLKYVKHRITEFLHPDCTHETVTYPHSFNIYSCVTADGIGRLHIIDGTLDVIKYIDAILEPELLPSIINLLTNNASFIFQQDSAPCHTVK